MGLLLNEDGYTVSQNRICFILCHELLDVTGKKLSVSHLILRRMIDRKELIQDNKKYSSKYINGYSYNSKCTIQCLNFKVRIKIL